MREVPILYWEVVESEMEVSGLFLALLVCFTFIQQWEKISVSQDPQFFQGDMCITLLFHFKKKEKKKKKLF